MAAGGVFRIPLVDDDGAAAAADGGSCDRSRRRRPPEEAAKECETTTTTTTSSSSSVGSRRRFVASSSSAAAAIASIAALSSFPTPIPAADAFVVDGPLTESINFQRSPVNRRSGITLAEPERVYPLPFITYLSRFLLVFDDACQRYWYAQARAIPPRCDGEGVERIRFRQFGQFAASVEVGLMDFEDGEGPRRLLDSLVERYGPGSSPGGYNAVDGGKAVGGDSSPSSSSSSSSTTATMTSTTTNEREVRKSKEALRQIALLFSLLDSEYQPIDSITQILAADDDATIERVELVDGGAGYPSGVPAPGVTFPDPPTLGTKFGGSIARGVAVMRGTGRVLRVELVDGGSGYYSVAPTVEIMGPPPGAVGGGGARWWGPRPERTWGRRSSRGAWTGSRSFIPGVDTGTATSWS